MRIAVLLAVVCWMGPGLALAQDREAGPVLTFSGQPIVGNIFAGDDETAVRLSDGIRLRFGQEVIDFGDSETRALQPSDQVPQAQSDTLDVFADYYPFDGQFRVTGGVRYELGPTARTFGYTPAERPGVGLGIGEDAMTPYVGIGYGAALVDGSIEITIDAGATYGEPALGAAPIEGSDGTAGSTTIAPVFGFSATYRF